MPTALNLPMADPLPGDTRKYFDVCQEKLGMIPNVLRAYAFDVEKLNAFTAMYNDLMLGESGLSKLEREMIAVVVSSINRCWYCQVAHGAAVRALSRRWLNTFGGTMPTSLPSFHTVTTGRSGLRRGSTADRSSSSPARAVWWNGTSRLLSITSAR